MKILCVADTQLGSGRDLADDRLADQERMLHQIAELAADEDAYVIHAGDVFESRHPSEEARMVFKRFASEAPVTVCAGNHDLRNAELPSPVDLYDHATFIRRPHVGQLFGRRDVKIGWLPWTPPHRLRADVGAIDQADLLVRAAADLRRELLPSQRALLVLHWPLSGATLPNGLATDYLTEPVLDTAALAAQGWDAIVAGHIHKPQMIPVGPPLVEGNGAAIYGPSAPVFYCGSPWVNDFGETAVAHGVWILDTDTWQAEFREVTDPRKFIDWTFAEEDVEHWVDGYRDAEDWFGIADIADTTIRVRYRATAEQARRIDHTAIRRLIEDAGGRLYRIEPEIVRSARARVEGVDETVGELEALKMWLDHQQIEHGLGERMGARTARYLEEDA